MIITASLPTILMTVAFRRFLAALRRSTGGGGGGVGGVGNLQNSIALMSMTPYTTAFVLFSAMLCYFFTHLERGTAVSKVGSCVNKANNEKKTSQSCKHHVRKKRGTNASKSWFFANASGTRENQATAMEYVGRSFVGQIAAGSMAEDHSNNNDNDGNTNQEGGGGGGGGSSGGSSGSADPVIISKKTSAWLSKKLKNGGGGGGGHHPIRKHQESQTECAGGFREHFIYSDLVDGPDFGEDAAHFDQGNFASAAEENGFETSSASESEEVSGALRHRYCKRKTLADDVAVKQKKFGTRTMGNQQAAADEMGRDRGDDPVQDPSAMIYFCPRDAHHHHHHNRNFHQFQQQQQLPGSAEKESGGGNAAPRTKRRRRSELYYAPRRRNNAPKPSYNVASGERITRTTRSGLVYACYDSTV